MNSTSNGLYIVISAFIGACASLLVSILTTWLSHQHQLERERQQWERNFRGENEKWRRDKTLETYEKCIFCLVSLSYLKKDSFGRIDITARENQSDFKKLFSELQLYLNLLLVSYSYADSKEFNTFQKILNIMDDDILLEPDILLTIRQQVIELMKKDARLKVDYNHPSLPELT